MIEIICAIISGITAVSVAVIAERTKKQNERTEKRAERRKEESMLSLQMQFATMNLAEVSANALTGGHNNGNVEDAKKELAEARAEYNKFLKRIETDVVWGKL